MSTDRRLLAAALKAKLRLQLNKCYDGNKPKSRPTKKQEAVLKEMDYRIKFVVAGNQSGKSTLGGRVTSWLFQETHPHWERPNNLECHHCGSDNFEGVVNDSGGDEEYRCHDCKKVWTDWGSEPLNLIVSCKVLAQTIELWEKKIKPFLPEGSYKEEKTGAVTTAVRNLENGNKIILLSHDKAIKSKDKIQSYVAHFVWIDEMPDHYLYLEESIQRVTAKSGMFLLTMTPKVKNAQVRDFVENFDESLGKKYQFGKLDNPIYQSPEKRAEVEAEVASLSRSMRNCVLHGDWLDSDESVFFLDRDRDVQPLPDNYSRDWEHVVSYDPAASGKGGLIIATRSPDEELWRLVKAQYIEGGRAPSDNIKQIDNIISQYHVVRKIVDSHESWFILEASKLARAGELQDSKPWVGVQKQGRKKDLIVKLQEAMRSGFLKFLPDMHDLFNEFTNAQWVEGRDDKIQGSQHYHLLDSLQYMMDLLPPPSKRFKKMTRDEWLIRASEAQDFAPKVPTTGRVRRTGRRRRH